MRFFVISKWALAVALGTLLGCSLAAAQKPDEGIAKARAAWESNFNSKNLPGLMSLYAEDAEMLPPSEDRLVGKDKIAAYFKALFDSASTVYVKLDSHTAVDSADLGYDSGSYENYIIYGGAPNSGASAGASGSVTTGGGGSREVASGSYLFVLTHKAGKWLFVQQAWTMGAQSK
jgi:ketosteroid isomerase-like protein